MNAQLLAILAGSLLGFGLWAVGGVLVPTAPRLADALDLLDGRLASAPGTSGTGIDRVGNWVRWRLRRPVTADTLRRLRMAGRSVDRHYAHKVLCALAGLLVPPMFGLGLVLSGGHRPRGARSARTRRGVRRLLPSRHRPASFGT